MTNNINTSENFQNGLKLSYAEWVNIANPGLYHTNPAVWNMMYQNYEAAGSIVGYAQANDTAIEMGQGGGVLFTQYGNYNSDGLENQDTIPPMPFTNAFQGYSFYKKKLHKQQGQDMNPIETVSPQHRTLLIIRASKNSSEEFKDRVLRTVGSFNTQENPKAVVVTVSDGKIYPGVTFSGNEPGEASDIKIDPKFLSVIVIEENPVRIETQKEFVENTVFPTTDNTGIPIILFSNDIDDELFGPK